MHTFTWPVGFAAARPAQIRNEGKAGEQTAKKMKTKKELSDIFFI